MAQSKKSAPESTAHERATIRRRAKEIKAQEAAAEALNSVLDKIASLEEPDKANAERIHAIVTKVAPSLTPCPVRLAQSGNPALVTDGDMRRHFISRMGREPSMDRVKIVAVREPLGSP